MSRSMHCWPIAFTSTLLGLKIDERLGQVDKSSKTSKMANTQAQIGENVVLVLVEDEAQKQKRIFIENFTRTMQNMKLNFKIIHGRKSHSRPFVKSYAPVYLKRNLRKITIHIDNYDYDDSTNFNITYDYMTTQEIQLTKERLKLQKHAPIFFTYRVLSLQKGVMDIKQKRFNAQMAKRYFPVSLNLLYGLLKDVCPLESLNIQLYFALLDFNKKYTEPTDEKWDWELEDILFYIQTNMVKSSIVNPPGMKLKTYQTPPS